MSNGPRMAVGSQPLLCPELLCDPYGSCRDPWLWRPRLCVVSTGLIVMWLAIRGQVPAFPPTKEVTSNVGLKVSLAALLTHTGGKFPAEGCKSPFVCFLTSVLDNGSSSSRKKKKKKKSTYFYIILSQGCDYLLFRVVKFISISLYYDF